ncbi:Putative regulatory protein [Salmonella enterica subsp. diarizonae]|uniref:Regulatory protein n=1 Tax=Salmonella diarizonae TaxID=59204 RepID=A0A379U053_SALDZ|nr:Putative regulatory protein [Salmonella enterica subsp. diarizonae]
MINAFAVERAFISCDALSLETGITNATMFEVGVKTRIISALTRGQYDGRSLKV